MTSFPPPSLQTAVAARDPAQRGRLHRALLDLADGDPLIMLRPNSREGQPQISVYGEVQQEVIADTLANDYGIDVTFEPLTVICVERPASRASAIRRMGEPGHRPGYTLGVTVEPAAPGAGVEVDVRADHLSLPLHVYGTVDAYATAVRGYLAAPLAAGPHGWEVTDVRVVVTQSDYPAAGPSAADVRHTVGIVVAEAIRRAGTVVCEPLERFSVETPEAALAPVLALLARHRAVPGPPQLADGIATVDGTIPAAELDAVGNGLHTAAHGEAVLESSFDHFSPVRAPSGTPSR